MSYYDSYAKRINRYGNTTQERIQGKREHDFEVFMKNSPNRVLAWDEEGGSYEAVLQTKEYDQDEVTDYLLVPLEKKIPMGTIIYTHDSRHKEVEYEGKKCDFTTQRDGELITYSARRWINYAIDPYTSNGYNRYTVVELESELSWVDEGIKYIAYAHATGGGSGARDKNINLNFKVQFSEAGVYLPNKRYSIVMPTNENLKKNMKVTLGGETWRVAGFDSISVKGVSYVTLEETLTDEKEDIPFANAGQLKNWLVTTNKGHNFTVMRDNIYELELYFYYNNEPRKIPYTIQKNNFYDIVNENNKILLKTKYEQVDTSLKILIDGWPQEYFFEIPFSIKDYTTYSLQLIGPAAVCMGETADYIIERADENGYNSLTLENSSAKIISQELDLEKRKIYLTILGQEIGFNKIIVGDYQFDFEVRSLWLGGGD